MPEKYKVQKATGVSVEEFYQAQDEAMKEPGVGKRSNLLRYSCLILARVTPLPTFEQFREMLDDDINALVDECKKLNPRHFSDPKDEPADEKKSAS